MVVLDTHVACWAVLDAEQLSANTRDIIEQTIAQRTLLMADISLWEIATFVQRQQLILSLPVQDWLQQLIDSLHLQIIPITPQIIADSIQLPIGLSVDIADPLIIATARCHQATLITHNEAILDWAQNGYLKALKA